MYIERILIMGAAGRDFHNFNICFKGHNKKYYIVGFTASQISGIDNRIYPKELAGKNYPNGIPIYPESQLTEIIKRENIDTVIFSYSDVAHNNVMHKASIVMAAGANFMMLTPYQTMLYSTKLIISVCAVRTGCGKSQTTRKICKILQEDGKKVVVVRHPMPYGNLKKQSIQRFETYKDFAQYNCTIEEREEYELIVEMGVVVYAGVDYESILRLAENEADVIIWDGGNNDTPFFLPDIHIVIFDPYRVGHELLYHPGETNLRIADIAIINKVENAKRNNIQKIKNTITECSNISYDDIIEANSHISIEGGSKSIKGKTVIVVEDGPTLTHGGMSFGAGMVIANKYGAKIINARYYAQGSIADIFCKYLHIDRVLPAMGYNKEQIKDLEDTINKADCDLVLFASPINPNILKINKPICKVTYEYDDYFKPTLENVLLSKVKKYFY